MARVQTLVLFKVGGCRYYARPSMYLKCHKRTKDGKEHRYWSIAQKLRISGTRTIDRHVLMALTAYRWIDPGSEWRMHREWYQRSAMGYLLNEGGGVGGEGQPASLPGPAA